MSAARKPGKAAGSGRRDSFSGGGAKGKDEVISVEEELWTLQLGARNPPCNVAKFEEVWVGKGEAQRKVTRPPLDNPRLFTPPAYMYREQEVEEHSEDEDFKAPVKMDAFERPVRKRRVIKSRAIQWVLEDSKDYAFGGGIRYLGNKTIQSSKYAIFRVRDAGAKEIEVTPIDEWWQFKKPPKNDQKMTVKEAEDMMKKQENFLGPLSLANKIVGKSNAAEAASASSSKVFEHLDREDAQELHEAGVKLGGPNDGADRVGSGKIDGDSDDDRKQGQDRDEMDPDAGGEDDDFGDEVRSDDEEEVGQDQANEGGGTLHQDDEELNEDDSENEYQSEDEAQEMQKLSRKTNAEMQGEDVYAVAEPGIADGNPAAPVAPSDKPAAASGAAAAAATAAAASGGGGGANSNGKRGSGAMNGDGDGAARGGAGGAGGAGGGDTKRAKKSTPKKKGGLEISQANVVDVLKLHGGRLSTKLVLSKFASALKVNGKADKAALGRLGEHLKKVATKFDDAIEGKMWVLKQHFS